jgi:RHS repeat-associated protein
LGSVVALSDGYLYYGNVAERYSYDVFGEPTIRNAQGNIISVSTYGNRYMFTGRWHDYETGNYYYRARYYSPAIGRFLQPDPAAVFLQLVSAGWPTEEKISGMYLSVDLVRRFLQNDPAGRFLRRDPAGRFLLNNQFGFPVELNLYTYCWNNPTIFIDPYGVNWWDTVKEWWKKPGNWWEWFKEWLKEISLPPPVGALEAAPDICRILEMKEDYNNEAQGEMGGGDLYPGL